MALGDTNYDKFCHIGKNIDKRINELGGQRFFNLHCADESTNLEEIVEAYKTGIILATKARLAEARKLSRESEINFKGDIDSTTTSDGNIENIENVDGADSPVKSSDNCFVLPHGILTLAQIVHRNNCNVDLHTQPEASSLPKARRAASEEYVLLSQEDTLSRALSAASISSDNALNAVAKSDSAKWTVESPFISKARSARWLTTSHHGNDEVYSEHSYKSIENWETERRVVELELDLTDSGITYNTGDSIAICVPNPENIVDLVLKRIQNNYKSSNASSVEMISRNTMVLCPRGEKITMFELLAYRYVRNYL